MYLITSSVTCALLVIGLKVSKSERKDTTALPPVVGSPAGPSPPSPPPQAASRRRRAALRKRGAWILEWGMLAWPGFWWVRRGGRPLPSPHRRPCRRVPRRSTALLRGNGRGWTRDPGRAARRAAPPPPPALPRTPRRAAA